MSVLGNGFIERFTSGMTKKAGMISGCILNEEFKTDSQHLEELEEDFQVQERLDEIAFYSILRKESTRTHQNTS